MTIDFRDPPTVRVRAYDEERSVLATFDHWHGTYFADTFGDRQDAVRCAEEIRKRHGGRWSAWRPEKFPHSYVCR